MRLSSLLIASLVCGCATVPGGPPGPYGQARAVSSASQRSALYIARAGNPAGSDTLFAVTLDGSDVGFLGVSSFFQLELAPGTHDVSVRGTGSPARLMVHLSPGQELVVLCDLDATADPDVRLSAGSLDQHRAAVQGFTKVHARQQPAGSLPTAASATQAGVAASGPRVITQESLGASDDGYGVSYEKKVVEQETRDVDAALLGSLRGGMMFASVEGGSGSKGFNAAFGLRHIDPEGIFPKGAESRLMLSYTASVAATKVSSSMPDGSSVSSTSFVLGGELTLGQVNFGALNSVSLEQEAWGVNAGVRMQVPVQSEAKPQFGPVFGLDFLSYNPGTAKVSVLTVMAMFLPASGVKTFMFSIGYDFHLDSTYPQPSQAP